MEMSDWEEACGWKRLDFQRPAFHPADLRRVGDLLSDPVTRAIGNDAFRFREPIWSEGRPALVSLGETLSNALAMAIRREALSFQEPPDWSGGWSAMCRVFGLDRRHHLFRAEPINWGPQVKFTEPQFTKGFAHFLGVPERKKRIWRTCALLKALGAAELGKDMCKVEVTPEALTSGNKRIDLLIEWKDSSERRCAAAIEAKLGHHVTSGQLPAYRGHLQNVPQERRLLIVISPRFNADVRDALQRQRSGEWRWMAWRDLLIAHERALSGEYDDDAYRQFRRTLWDQAG